jgi:hypothetical protein
MPNTKLFPSLAEEKKTSGDIESNIILRPVQGCDAVAHVCLRWDRQVIASRVLSSKNNRKMCGKKKKP